MKNGNLRKNRPLGNSIVWHRPYGHSGSQVPPVFLRALFRGVTSTHSCICLEQHRSIGNRTEIKEDFWVQTRLDSARSMRCRNHRLGGPWPLVIVESL